MAMDGDALGTAIHDELVAAGLPLSGDALSYFKAMGRGVVSYLTANAVVTVPVEPSDVALQSVGMMPQVPTNGPVVATSLDGTIS